MGIAEVRSFLLAFWKSIFVEKWDSMGYYMEWKGKHRESSGNGMERSRK